MKNILSTLTVLFILLTSSMSWGSVDGNGVICEETTESKWFPYPFFLIFEYGTVHHKGVKVKNDVIIKTKGDVLRYKTSPSTISWHNVVEDDELRLTHILNRKDLSLKILFNKQTLNLECEVYPTKILMEKVDRMIEHFQSEYDKKKKDNKI
ncbi:hypothetical protein N9315_02700 [Alphaproteobacteria bacterium]|nr:hypothetical protein [Alphaproteobacteria bacterium]